MKIDKLSYSRMSTFKQCQYRYFLQYDRGYHVKCSPILQKGIDVHKEFERFFREFKGDFHEFVAQWKYNPDFEVEIKNFLKYEKERWDSLENKSLFKPFFLEKEMTVKNPYFGGIVDRVHMTDKGECVLVDYKTGKVRDFEQYESQLGCYIFLLTELGLVQRIDKVLIFWVSQGEYKELKPYFYDHEKVREELKKIKFDIQCCLKPKMSPSWLCNYCDYTPYCAVGKRMQAKKGCTTAK
jgi:RecB family exonuclease